MPPHDELALLQRLEAIDSKHEWNWILQEAQSLDLKTEKRAEFLENCVSRRESGEPLAYIFGHWSFGPLELEVGPGVLIPRPETEELASLFVAEVAKKKNSFEYWHIVDAGAGSGCLGLMVAAELLKQKILEPDQLKLTLIESSELAYAYLQKNTDVFGNFLNELGIEKPKVIAFQGSWQSWKYEAPIQALLSNPPYISKTEADQPDATVASYEPSEALFPDDLDQRPDATGPYLSLLRFAKLFLAPNGLVAFEHGFLQKDALDTLAKEQFPDFKRHFVKDISGKNRFFFLQRLF